MKNTVDGVIEYLVENGMDEDEVDHYLYEKQANGKTLMKMIVAKEWDDVWRIVNNFIFGDIWQNN
jgi:hypothetical protein